MEADELKGLQRKLANSITHMRPLDEIRLLLAQGARINLPITEGFRPLHYAVFQKYEDCVELLLARGCKLDLMNDAGFTGLHLASQKGYLKIVKMLVEAGAQVRFTDNKNLQPLADEPLRLAIKGGYLDVAEYLLNHGADPNAIYFQGPELHLAAAHPCSVRLLELLLRQGANLESRDRNGYTPLMRAASQYNGYDAVKLFLRYGANVNVYAPELHEYRSALHFAIIGGNLSTLRLLLFAGAQAAYPSEQLNKSSPLDLAILRGDLTMIRLLIQFGAQLNTGSSLVGLPLHVALSEKVPRRLETLDLLLEHGANPNLTVDSVDKRGPVLKPPVGEYLNNSKQLQPAVIRTLLKYNARVICTAQVQHPLGILKCLNKLRLPEPDHQTIIERPLNDDEDWIDGRSITATDKQILDLLLQAAERFNIQAIRRCSLLNETQRQYLLKHATQPRTLKHLSRLALRRYAFAAAELSFNYDSQGHTVDVNCLSDPAGVRSLSRSSSGEADTNWNGESEEKEDSYVLNRNAYKRYVGNRFQKYYKRCPQSLVCEHDQCDPDTCDQLRFARTCGLTSEEMEILRARKQIPQDEQEEIFALPVGYRTPLGSDWPLRLIQINSNYHDYHVKYAAYQPDWCGNLCETFQQFHPHQFKSAASFALFLLQQLPLPTTLKDYLYYQD